MLKSMSCDCSLLSLFVCIDMVFSRAKLTSLLPPKKKVKISPYSSMIHVTIFFFKHLQIAKEHGGIIRFIQVSCLGASASSPSRMLKAKAAAEEAVLRELPEVDLSVLCGHN